MPPYRSIKELHDVAVALGCNDMVKQLERIENTYYYKLQYLCNNPANKSEADTIYIWNELEAIISRLKKELKAQDTDTLYGTQHRYQSLRPEENLQSLISDYLAESERLRTDVGALTDSRSRARLEQIAGDIFNRLWTAFDLSEDTALLLDILNDGNVEISSRLLWLNALGLRAAQENEIESTIFDAMAVSVDRRLSIAAQVWKYIYCFSRQIFVDKQEYKFTVSPGDILWTIVDLFCSPADDSLMADMTRLSTRFQGINLSDTEALKNLNLSAEDYESISRFQEAQARGADVMGATLGRMRQFPFFSRLENWFLPFDAAHSALADITDGEGAEVVEQIAALPNITDSDKYAMVLSMSQMPPSMRARSLSAMVDTMRAMSDTPEYQEALKELGNVPDKLLISAMLQGVARFVRSYPRAGEFNLGKWLNPSAILGNIEMYGQDYLISPAEKKRYADALLLLDRDSDKAKEIYGELLLDDPDNMDVALKLAKMSRDYHEVIRLLEPFKDSRRRDVLDALVDAYADGLYFDEALEICQRLDYETEGKDYDIRIRLVQLYIGLRRYEKANQILMDVPRERRNDKIPFLEVISAWLTGDGVLALALLDELYEDKRPADLEDFVAPLQQSIDRIIRIDDESVLLLPDIVRYRYGKERY